MKTSRLLEFDVLRSAAMLYVVGFFHLFKYFKPLIHVSSNYSAHFLARIALGAFVFISAYLLSSRGTITSWEDVKTFFNRRFWRIYPLFFLTLMAFWVMRFIDSHVFASSALLIIMLTHLQLFTLWFVTMIFLFYLVTPLYLWKESTFKTIGVTAVLFVALMTLHRVTGGVDMRLPMYLLIFAAGVVAAKRTSLWAAVSSFWGVLCGVVLCAAILYFIKPTGAGSFKGVSNPSIDLFWNSLSILSILPFFIAVSRLLAKVIPQKPLLLLSHASFAMYLVHRIAYDLLLKIYKPSTLIPALAYALCVMVPIAFVLGLCVQNTYDWILNRFFPMKRRVEAAAATA